MTPNNTRKPYSRRITLAAVVVLAAAALSLAAFLAFRPDPDPFAADAVTDPAFESLTYSIQAFLWWDGGEAGLNLDWARMMGFSHIKQTFAWADLELAPGVWQWDLADSVVEMIESRGLNLVARLGHVPDWAHSTAITVTDRTDSPPDDLSTWANYCATVADRYRGRIAAYQIWNEPNLSREWGGQAPNASGYVELLAVCSEAIRAVDPDAVLISAGLAPTGNEDATALRDDIYLQQMYDAGFQQYVDAVGVHAPGYDAPEVGPDDAVAKGRQRWMSFRRVEDLRKIMVTNGDAARQMAILEVGYTTDPLNPDYSWFAVTEEQQADYLRRAYAYAAEHWRPWVGLMSTIYLAKPTWTEANEEYWWAVTVPNRDENGMIQIYTRPAFDTLLRMPKVCGDRIKPEVTSPEVPLVPDNPCN